MALSRLNYNSLNVTPTASKGIGFDSGADDLAATFSGGAMVFIKKLTSDGSDDDLSFVDGTSDVVLDSTYKEYLFIFKDIHPETDAADFGFQANVAGGSGYDETITSSYFRAVHNEADTASTLSYDANRDQAQGTGFQEIASDVGNENDQSACGSLHLFNPSSTTFTKHFILRSSVYIADTGARDQHVAGYFNVTAAIDEIQFKFNSGEIQAGTITLYGIN